MRLPVGVDLLDVLVAFDFGDAAEGVGVAVAVDEDDFLHLVVLRGGRVNVEVGVEGLALDARVRLVALAVLAAGAAAGVVGGLLQMLVRVLDADLQVLDQHLLLSADVLLHVHIEHFVERND